MSTFMTGLKSRLRGMLSSPASLILFSFGFLVFADVLDIISSIGAFEQNPYARDFAHRFVLSKGIVLKAAYEMAIFTAGAFLYGAFKRYDEWFAAGVASTVYIIIALDVLGGAVIPNFLLKLGFYVP